MKIPDIKAISEESRSRYFKALEPVEQLLIRMKVRPNMLSVAGLVLSAVAGSFLGFGAFFWGACLIALAGVADTLDGSIARNTDTVSEFGAFFDSTLDRYGEAVIFLGFIWYFARTEPGLAAAEGVEKASAGNPWTVAFILLALAGSFMVSYARARAEGLGLQCKGGFFLRPERMALLVIGSLLGALPVVGIPILKFTFFIFACLANATAVQRILFVRKILSTGP